MCQSTCTIPVIATDGLVNLTTEIVVVIERVIPSIRCWRSQGEAFKKGNQERKRGSTDHLAPDSHHNAERRANDTSIVIFCPAFVTLNLRPSHDDAVGWIVQRKWESHCTEDIVKGDDLADTSHQAFFEFTNIAEFNAFETGFTNLRCHCRGRLGEHHLRFRWVLIMTFLYASARPLQKWMIWTKAAKEVLEIYRCHPGVFTTTPSPCSFSRPSTAAANRPRRVLSERSSSSSHHEDGQKPALRSDQSSETKHAYHAPAVSPGHLPTTEKRFALAWGRRRENFDDDLVLILGESRGRDVGSLEKRTKFHMTIVEEKENVPWSRSRRLVDSSTQRITNKVDSWGVITLKPHGCPSGSVGYNTPNALTDREFGNLELGSIEMRSAIVRNEGDDGAGKPTFGVVQRQMAFQLFVRLCGGPLHRPAMVEVRDDSIIPRARKAPIMRPSRWVLRDDSKDKGEESRSEVIVTRIQQLNMSNKDRLSQESFNCRQIK
ncbi:hypothetical protein BDZ89DRAFT_1040816 [Hymenopellis radicata]|nr:hypothetical protein BDZ89DRAFT_1040816 [Hymenopellis radicata]